LKTFGPDFYKLLSRFIPFLPHSAQGQRRALINDGEMLLVLGRPGSGCSTFLKAISNQRESFAGVKGDVSYGGIPAAEQKKKYRGEVNYNEEDDQHLPTLTVGQTLEFSLLNKTRKHEKGDIPIIITALMKMFGITHTRNTLVGDVGSSCILNRLAGY
jgi:ATP-binding cassette subfamily G (WHITE) protein 2 (SNQ2)